MRHAKSDWRGGSKDFDRPLSRRGGEDAAAMARWLAVQPRKPSYIVSSPALRAAQTATLIGEALDGVRIDWEPRLYLADVDQLLSLISRPPKANWLIIGHNPGLEDLVLYLDRAIRRTIDSRKLMPTAAMFAFDWENAALPLANTGKLLFHQRPKLLQSR
ncbi:MAG: phosphohistidine phosphatase [Gammaproteobacteria bacterium]|jgi:phosphohistidine phosphatase